MNKSKINKKAINRNALAKEVLHITQTMLDKARAGHWQDLADMEIIRKHCLDEYFAGEVDHDHAQEAEIMIKAVLTADKELIEIVAELKKVYIKEHSSLKEGHVATKAYQVNQG